jgi:hypothetical protein
MAGKKIDRKKYDVSIECPFCDYHAETGEGMVDHMISTDHPASGVLRKELSANHKLYSELAKDMESARDSDEGFPQSQSKASAKLASKMSNHAISEIGKHCEVIANLMSDNNMPSERIHRCAHYLVGRLGLLLSGAPDELYGMLDTLADDTIKKGDALLKEMKEKEESSDD